MSSCADTGRYAVCMPALPEAVLPRPCHIPPAMHTCLWLNCRVCLGVRQAHKALRVQGPAQRELSAQSCGCCRTNRRWYRFGLQNIFGGRKDVHAHVFTRTQHVHTHKCARMHMCISVLTNVLECAAIQGHNWLLLKLCCATAILLTLPGDGRVRRLGKQEVPGLQLSLA